MASLKVVSPVDGRIYAERPLAGASEIAAALAAARKAYAAWRSVPIADRAALCARFVDAQASGSSGRSASPTPTCSTPSGALRPQNNPTTSEFISPIFVGNFAPQA